MKCEKCGKEANFHYRSNINGKVTTMNLCSECAEKSDKMGMMNMDQVFNDMYNDMFNMFGSMFTPMMLSPWRGVQRTLRPRMRIVLEPMDDTRKIEKNDVKTEQQIDPEMSRRREINALREQMKAAVSNEDFEKAAELRDKIRELDNRADG
ncbi:MAG: hypothetical protein E7456_02840 [Ruminococcaceae bacterium]|nr:hypothetical protein [Oscillospiraceae bacterium]